MDRRTIIQYLIDQYELKNYLEIGVKHGEVFNNLKNLNNKVGVDPNINSKATIFQTSDEYFLNLQKDIKFDIIFIDGWHEDVQVERDIINSLEHLEPDGFIVCHDMSPAKEIHQDMSHCGKGGAWNGNCWKAWVKFRSIYNNLEMHVVDCDYGCGIIRRGKQELIEPIELTYANLDKNRQKLLNLISYEEFITKFKRTN